jgi:RNA polymerase sigma-70 factor (ECF subfamily)
MKVEMALDINIQDKQSFDDRFLRLLLKNHYKIYAYILAFTHNTNDADDVMQDVSTILWKKFNKFKAGTNFTAWAVKVARYKVLQFYQNKEKEEFFFLTAF